MLTIQVVCVGKLKERAWREACQEYAKRLSGSARVQIIEVAQAHLPDKPSQAQVDAALLQEGKSILEKVSPGAFLVSLCIEGTMLDSPGLAQKIGDRMAGGTSTIAFVIGGSFGLSGQVKERSGLRLSMSRMTFPHQLARVMLLEQVYRVMNILGNGKYHK